MDKIRVVLKSKRGTHYAEGFYEGGKITVVKGSRIYVDNATYMNLNTPVFAMRADRTIVDDQGIVLRDVVFDSPTTAAIFVTGRSVNGMIAWRPDDKVSLKEYMKGRS